MRQKILSISQSLRLPSICILCYHYHNNRLAICEECISTLPALDPGCYHCAYPLPTTNYPICGYCIKKPPHFDKAIIAYRFEDPLRSLLHQFKYNNGLYLAKLLSSLMMHAWQTNPSQAECLIPVPMHASRIKYRGYNQAVVLTKLLAKQLKLPYDLHSCRKVLNTKAQADLARSQRQKNLFKAFDTKVIPYNHVALIDDLLTTGNTANEVALSLKQAGVERVDIWCCARAIFRS